MIAWIQGRLLKKMADWVVVDVGGVGYRLSVSRQTLERLPPLQQEVSFEVHTHVREDAISLFGFLDAREQGVFAALIGMSGMGPKAAMAVLSGVEAAEFARAVSQEDLARLCLIPGIGKKKAERIILELKDTMAVLAESGTGETPVLTVLEDLRSALVNMGFKPNDATRASSSMRERILAGEQLEQLLPEALRLLRE